MEDVAVAVVELTTTVLWANPLASAPLSDRLECRVLWGIVGQRSLDRVLWSLFVFIQHSARGGL